VLYRIKRTTAYRMRYWRTSRMTAFGLFRPTVNGPRADVGRKSAQRVIRQPAAVRYRASGTADTIVTATRRLRARFSGVSFNATGTFAACPTAVSRPCALTVY